MKFGCSLELVNMRTSGPNFIIKQSKFYWIELFKMISAVGFKGIELPYNPYSSEPIFFEIGRCGMPISTFAVNSKYGSIRSFFELLNDIGIEEVTSVHISANEILQEILASDGNVGRFFSMYQSLADEAMEFLIEIGGEGLVITPTPEIGLLSRHMGRGGGEWQQDFMSRTVNALNTIAGVAAEKNIRVAVKNEYWGLTRGASLNEFMGRLDRRICYSPDLAHIVIAGADPVETITGYKERLGFVRFSDTTFEDVEDNFKKIDPETPVKGKQKVYCDLGEGAVDIPGVYGLMRQSAYDGWVICESKMTLNVPRALLKMRWYIDHVLLRV